MASFAQVVLCTTQEPIVFVMLWLPTSRCAGVGQMSSLKVFDASYNNLQGPLPFLSGGNLQQLYLDHNNLTGDATYSGFATSYQFRCWSLDNNPGLCGSLPVGARCLDTSGTNIGKPRCLAC